jgi:hypothetical protein
LYPTMATRFSVEGDVKCSLRLTATVFASRCIPFYCCRMLAPLPAIRLPATVFSKFPPYTTFLRHIINISSPTFYLPQRFSLHSLLISHYNHKILFLIPIFYPLSIFLYLINTHVYTKPLKRSGWCYPESDGSLCITVVL